MGVPDIKKMGHASEGGCINGCRCMIAVGRKRMEGGKKGPGAGMQQPPIMGLDGFQNLGTCTKRSTRRGLLHEPLGGC